MSRGCQKSLSAFFHFSVILFLCLIALVNSKDVAGESCYPIDCAEAAKAKVEKTEKKETKKTKKKENKKTK